jgi:hypothetical protein
MSRHLLQIVRTPQSLLAMTPDELAGASGGYASTCWRPNGWNGQSQLAGCRTRNSYDPDDRSTSSIRTHNALEKAGRAGYALLEEWGLIEADNEPNGRNGFVVLTSKGRMATPGTDFERIRVRGLLREEMLHLATKIGTVHDPRSAYR